MEARLLYRGRIWEISLLADGDREFAREFVDRQLTRVQQAQMRQLLKRAADLGLPNSIEQFRMLRGHANLGEFKQRGVRLFCFFDGPGRIVLIHGFKKMSNRTPRQEIERARQLRDAYLAEKRA